MLYAQDEEWKLEKNKGGVAAYTRRPEGKSIKEYKIITTVDTDLKTIIDIITNADEFHKWMVNLKHAETLEKVSDHEFYNYFQANLPWPFSDRDMIVNLSLDVDWDKKECVAYSKTTPNYTKECDGYERLKIGRGKWQIKEKNDKVYIRYEFIGDPGIPAPAWLINMFIVDGPHQSFVNLREFAEKKHASLQ